MSDQELQIVSVGSAAPFDWALAALHDIPMAVSTGVGRLSIPVKEFLRLGPASVLDLKKADGESFEVAISALVRGLLKKRPP